MKRQIIETGRWIMEKNLTWGSSGNISARDGERIYITASGTVMGDLKEEDILVCDLDGNLLEDGEGRADEDRKDSRKGLPRKPSKETGMHLEVYRRRKDVGAIIHTSPFYGTFCACCDMELKTNLFIESMYYDESVTRIPYFHAGSRELAGAVGAVCETTHVILMEHHGILVYDKSLAECRTGLEVTENVCKMNILARSGNLPLTEVEPGVVRDFLEGGYFKKRR